MSENFGEILVRFLGRSREISCEKVLPLLNIYLLLYNILNVNNNEKQSLKINKIIIGVFDRVNVNFFILTAD